MTAVEVGSHFEPGAGDDMTTRFYNRFNWGGNGVIGMGTKLFSCVLAVISCVLAFAPFGTTACGVLLASSLFSSITSALMLGGFLVLLVAGLVEYHMARDKNRSSGADDDEARIEDRRFAIFYTFVGAGCYSLITFLNAMWTISNWSINTQAQLVASTGKYVTEPFAAVAAASSVLAFFVTMAFATMLYTNTVGRLNRSLINTHE